MNMKISPSMMCADIANLKAALTEFEKCKIEYLHIDIMDGHFVPNFTLGTDYCKSIRKLTNIPLDIHLMINDPELKLEWFDFGDGDMVSVHAESTKHLQKALAYIKSKGAKAFVALNPSTPLCVLDEIVDDIEGVLVMAVNPGFAGQKMVPNALDKIRRVREYLDKNHFNDKEIEVDGNVSYENALKMKSAGANIFVAGTSSIFNPNYTLTDGIEKMRNILR